MTNSSIWLLVLSLIGESLTKDYHRDHGQGRHHKDDRKGIYGAKNRDIPFEGEKHNNTVKAVHRVTDYGANPDIG